jgi:hemoglobin/transferrin/lactoferrin receptor protein
MKHQIKRAISQPVVTRGVGLCISIWSAVPVAAQQETARTESSGIALQLDSVTVSATRDERPKIDVPASVTVFTAEEIEQKRIEDIRDLVRHEPGVSVRRQPARFSAAGAGTGRDGNASFNIRGIDGNRVLIQVDGIRLPNAFSFGATNIGRGDYLDLSSVARTEILRGPASALYGSDGLAGAVSFYTREPRDLLSIFKRPTYISLGIAYSQEDKGASATLAAAATLGTSDALIIATKRQSSELENFGMLNVDGANRTAPNPQENQSSNLFLKWVTPVSETNRITGTLEALDRSSDTDVRTAIGPIAFAPPTLRVAQLLANDDVKRSRATVSQVLSALDLAAADKLQWSLYAQDASTRQLSREFRTDNQVRVRDQNYTERVLGVSTQANKLLEIAGVTHQLIYGADFTYGEFIGNTNGTLPPRGESFPTKRFPDTDYNLTGVFVQDEISFAQERVLVIPALRYDRYTLKPEVSVQFASGIPAASSGSAVSPKLGVVWKFQPGWSVYTNLAQGFRAPTPNQVNQGFTNVVSFYQSIANPDLKPEKNTSLEVGLRHTSTNLSFEAAAFTGRYKDFIAQAQVAGSFAPNDPAIFQFVNLGQVKLSGFETKATWRLPAGWRLQAGYARVRGREQDEVGVISPLSSVDPPRLLVGAGWRSPAATGGLDLAIIHSAAKKSADADMQISPTAQQFLPAGFTTVDLTGFWQFTRYLSLSFSLTNLSNKKYWQWSDVQGLASTSAALDAYTQPGRSFSVALKAQY